MEGKWEVRKDGMKVMGNSCEGEGRKGTGIERYEELKDGRGLDGSRWEGKE